MDFKEKRAVQKSITENLSKLEKGDLSFLEKRAVQKEITADFVKIGEASVAPLDQKIVPGKTQLADSDAEVQAIGKANITSVGDENVYVEKDDGTRYSFKPINTGKYEEGPYDFSNEIVFDDGTGKAKKPTPAYDRLKAGAFIDLPASEFVDKLKEAAKELGVEDSLTMDIISPAAEWKDKREEVANEGVEQDVGVDSEDENSATESTEPAPTEEELVDEIKGDYEFHPSLATEGIATEKAKNVDEKLWKYAKKIVLRARFDKKPSGDNEKDNDIITGGDAWGFVQDRYQKLVSRKIKPRKTATESVDVEVEDDEEYIIS